MSQESGNSLAGWFWWSLSWDCSRVVRWIAIIWSLVGPLHVFVDRSQSLTDPLWWQPECPHETAAGFSKWVIWDKATKMKTTEQFIILELTYCHLYSIQVVIQTSIGTMWEESTQEYEWQETTYIGRHIWDWLTPKTNTMTHTSGC